MEHWKEAAGILRAGKISRILDRIKVLWPQHPELSLEQFLVRYAGFPPEKDPPEMQDEQTLKCLEMSIEQLMLEKEKERERLCARKKKRKK